MDRAEAIKAMQFYKRKLYNGIYNQYIEAFDMAIAALREQEQLARNLQQRANNEQVTEPLRPNGFSGLENELATKNQVKLAWISVKDDLPKKEGSYIVATKNGGVMLTHFYPKGRCFSSTRLNRLVTHWMERPKPPEGGADHA